MRTKAYVDADCEAEVIVSPDAHVGNVMNKASKPRLQWVGPEAIKSIWHSGKEYCVALGATFLAALICFPLGSYLDDSLAYVMFLVAVTVTTWYGGVGPSCMAVVLGGVIANWFFIHPRYTLSLTGPVDQVGLAVYVTISFALVGFMQTWRWSWEKTEQMAQDLRNELDRHKQTDEEPAHLKPTADPPQSQRKHQL